MPLYLTIVGEMGWHESIAYFHYTTIIIILLACVPLYPLNIVVDNNTIASGSGEWCGERLEFIYPRQASIKDIVVEVQDKCSNGSTKIAVLDKGVCMQCPKYTLLCFHLYSYKELVGVWPCTKRLLLTNSNTLLVTATHSNVCIKTVTAYDCHIHSTRKQFNKRSAVSISSSNTATHKSKSTGR